MSQTLVFESEEYVPGSASLRVEAGEGGIRQVTPRVLGEGLLAGPAGPMVVTWQGRRLSPLADYIGSAPGEKGWVWNVETDALVGTWEVSFRPDGLQVDFDFEVLEDAELVTPLAVPVDGRGGWLLLPGEQRPVDLASPIEASRRHAVGRDQTAAWSLASQGGFLVQMLESNRPMDAIRTLRLDERQWLVCLAFENLRARTRVTGRVDFRVVPFNGAVRLEQVLDAPLRLIPNWREHPDHTPEAYALHGEGTIELEPLGLPLTIRMTSEGVPLDPERMEIAQAAVRQIELYGEPVAEVTVVVQSSEDVPAVRLDARLQTPCGNPTWEGEATVFIPGNFARSNYHPDHLHGGGPKWGPSETPMREPLTANDDAAGCCHGWTFSASRLPQVWAAAADRTRRCLIWIGTTPRCDFGETCAGFVSPAGKTTLLRLATPTTYEPWVPLGYSRMRPEPRRDALTLQGGRLYAWTFYIAVRETQDLNGWAALDRALYLRNRPLEPVPLKLSRDEAIVACASALFEHFYDAERRVIRYSTGPQGAHALVGFTGMAHSALVLLWAGTDFDRPEWREAGTQVLDTVAEMFLQGPAFPWTLCEAEAGKPFRHGSGEPGYVVMVAFDNLAEAVRRERAAGRAHPKWEQALRRCAEAWVANQSPEGAYPHWGPAFSPEFSDNDYATTNVEAGVMANMVDAFELFGDSAFLESARRAAVKYGRDLDDGRLWGGPGDIRALVNSEVPMFFLRGFRRLFEATRDATHRRWMLTAAAWRFSFQFAHSWAVEKHSPLWRQGWAGLGAEGASACNLHAVAFGCINVPDYAALWQITDDDYHRMRCNDLARYSAQQYARFSGDLGFPFAGAGTESWWTSESVWGKGVPWIFTNPGFDLGFMSWVTGWSGYGALCARELGIDF
jgi:hypothetical protein